MGLLLGQNEGCLPFSDKSSPEEIFSAFKVSKKNFKRTLTELIEAKKIQLLDDSIALL